jgi:hypothetical protein
MTSNAQAGTRILGSLRSADGKGVVRIEDRFDTPKERHMVTQPRFSRRLAMLLIAGTLALSAAADPAAASAQPNSLPRHQVHCVLADGHLFLGSAGAVHPRRTVTCSVHFYQLIPHADGVIVALNGARHHSSYSVIIKHLAVPPTGRTAIPWLNHPAPAKLHCALVRGHLYLGSAGAGSPRRTVTCSVRFYQLIPHADGVIVALKGARHHSSYSVEIKHLLVPPTGRTLIRWIA